MSNLITINGQETIGTLDNISPSLAYVQYVSATAVKILAGTTIKIGSNVFLVPQDRTLGWADIDTGSEAGGKDYHIFACNNSGNLTFLIHLTTAYNDYIDINGIDAGGLTYPSGYTSATARLVGGFHNNSTDTIATAGDILQYSIWDCKNRPSSPDPRGMVKSKFKKLWYDIYLASAWDLGVVVTSMPGSDPYNQPTYKVRSVYQSTIWDTMTWYFANQRGINSGKRLVSYDEFIDMATGTPENQNILGAADPVTTGGHVGATASVRIVSVIGAEDCAGVLYQYERNFEYNDDAGSTWAWVNNTGGYGGQNTYHTNDPSVGFMGGDWTVSTYGGSRCNNRRQEPNDAYDTCGARYCCTGL